MIFSVNLGEVNIAVDSTGKIFSNDKIKKHGLNIKSKEAITKRKTRNQVNESKWEREN
jgi:hypothetical protein